VSTFSGGRQWRVAYAVMVCWKWLEYTISFYYPPFGYEKTVFVDETKSGQNILTKKDNGLLLPAVFT